MHFPIPLRRVIASALNAKQRPNFIVIAKMKEPQLFRSYHSAPCLSRRPTSCSISVEGIYTNLGVGRSKWWILHAFSQKGPPCSPVHPINSVRSHQSGFSRKYQHPSELHYLYQTRTYSSSAKVVIEKSACQVSKSAYSKLLFIHSCTPPRNNPAH